MNKSIKACFCAINSKYIHSSLAPWCLVAGVKKWGNGNCTAVVCETTINAPETDILAQLEREQPNLIGISTYIWNITYVKNILPKIKQLLPNAKILLGGPEVSYNPAEVFDTVPQVDYIICGEGEKPVAELLNFLSCNFDEKIEPQPLQYPKIGGETATIQADQSGETATTQADQTALALPCLASRNCDFSAVVPNTPSEIPPTPYCDEYFKALKNRIVYLETSRGCPYSCAFCLSGRCGNARFYPIERAKAEMVMLAQSGTQTVKLVDRTFNCNKTRAYELWQFVVQNYGKIIPSGVCFHFEIAGDILDDASIKLLQTAPCGSIQLEIGMQSFHEPTLAAINRKTNTEKLKENIRALLCNKNIHVHIDLIAGLPLETFDIFKDSFNTGYKIGANMLQMGFLKLLHGAPLEQTAEENGIAYSKTPPYEILENKWLSAEEMAQLHKIEDALERFCNSGRFSYTLQYLESVCISDRNSSPFDFFLGFGENVQAHYKTGLDEFCENAYRYLCTINGVDKTILRDTMALDRLATNSMGRLPACLKVKDDDLKKAVIALAANADTAPKKAMRRGVVLLYSQNKKVAWVDYDENLRDKVSKKWQINFKENW